jgi:hypothetical protein
MLPILIGLALVTAGGAEARSPATSGPLPRGIHAVVATITFPKVPMYVSRHPIERTFTSAAKVTRLVSLVDGLRPASRRVVCPALVFLGPQLTLAFSAGAGPAHPILAQARVQVVLGSHGHSGQSPCFPIRLEVGGRPLTPRVSSTFVRAVGQAMHVTIS